MFNFLVLLTLTQEENAILLKVILDKVSYMSDTIDSFTNFIKDDTYEIKEQFSLNRLIKEMELLINPILKVNFIKYIISNDVDIMIEGYKNEFLQILLNILINTKDVLIKRNINIPRLIFIDVKKEDSKIIIKIKDNADGISENTINKIFENHFPIKDKANKKKLGLYMCKQIIEKSMKGKIKVSNVEYLYNGVKYKGSEFIIELPI
jgi:signal transduction histidine kinase